MKVTARRLALVLLAAAPASQARLLPIVDVGPARPNEVANAVEVAAGVDGTFLVLWAATDQAGEEVALATRQLAADGQPIGPPVVREQSTYLVGRIAPRAGGGYFEVVVRPLGGNLRAVLRLTDAAGTPVSADVLVDAGRTEIAAVAAFPSGGAVVALAQEGSVRARLFDEAGQPRSGLIDVSAVPSQYFIDPLVAAGSDGSFLVAYFPNNVSIFDAAGSLRAVVGSLPGPLVVHDVATLPGIGFAVADGRLISSTFGMVAERVSTAGQYLGGVVGWVPPDLDTFGLPAVASDGSGNLHLAWQVAETLAPSRRRPPQAQDFDAAGTPLTPIYDLVESGTVDLATAASADGHALTAWIAVDVQARVTTLCTPADVAATCGNGTLDPRCEDCDDGAANSDTLPDACRTNCASARCGDGVIDTGEECDDHDTEPCDGCDAACRTEPPRVCGDGILLDACGERCDDGNQAAGDGCAADCTFERIAGGGGPRDDCLTEWVVNNPTNVPLTDTRGFRTTQTCVDDDPRCDFDGGTPGSCTFHVRVCGNNTNTLGCTVERRLAGWRVDRPSASQAARKPAALAIRTAFAPVPGLLVGPIDPDRCSDELSVPVPLRARAVGYGPAKWTLRVSASTYTGRRDSDKLKLVCVPR